MFKKRPTVNKPMFKNYLQLKKKPIIMFKNDLQL